MGEHKHKFIVLDGLRGVAAISVVFYHFSRVVGARMLPNALLSVDFFFMLSGFVVAYAYEERIKHGLGICQFMKIRLIRLYPLYFLSITLPALVTVIRGFLMLPHDDLLCTTLTYILHCLFLPTPNSISLKFQSAFPLNGPSWSLSAEIWINALYALLCVFFNTRRLKWMVLVCAMILVAAVSGSSAESVGQNLGLCPRPQDFQGMTQVSDGGMEDEPLAVLTTSVLVQPDLEEHTRRVSQ